jgi:hypothetical protein
MLSQYHGATSSKDEALQVADLQYLSTASPVRAFDNVNRAAMVQLRRPAMGDLDDDPFLLAPCCGQTFFEVGPA